MAKLSLIIGLATSMSVLITEQAPQAAAVTQRITTVVQSDELATVLEAMAAIRGSRQQLQPQPQTVPQVPP